MSDPYSIGTPYRKPGEKEPSVKPSFNWSLFFDRAWVAIQVVFWIAVTGGVITACNACLDRDEAIRQARRNTCQIQEDNRTFAVRVYDETGSSYRTEAFFSIRREAEDFLTTLPQCEKK